MNHCSELAYFYVLLSEITSALLGHKFTESTMSQQVKFFVIIFLLSVLCITLHVPGTQDWQVLMPKYPDSSMGFCCCVLSGEAADGWVSRMWELAAYDYQLFIVLFGISTVSLLGFLFWKVMLEYFPDTRNSAWSVNSGCKERIAGPCL